MIDLNPRNELQWVKEGRVYQSRHGELSTPQAVEPDLVRQKYDMAVLVPEGTVIVPLRTQVVMELTGAEVFKCLISSCDNHPGVASHSPFTPVNQNTQFATRGSKVTSYFLSAGDSGTAPTNVVDLLRAYVELDIDSMNEFATFEQVVYDPLRGLGLPAVIGKSSSRTTFLVYVANASTSTGYILTSWAEWPYDEFYA